MSEGPKVSIAEQKLSRSLRSVLADLPNGASIPDSATFRYALTALQFFIPRVLAELYREWRFEGLDGVLPVVAARKTGEGEAEIFGICCLVSDQTVTPIHLRLQLAASGDEVSWLECRLGMRGKHGMLRMPYDSLNAMTRRLLFLKGGADEIDWVYKVTFGDRRL